MTTPVTIIIPHFCGDLLLECLDSLYAHSDLPIEVLVVDDGPDAPCLNQAQKRFPKIQILRNEANMGFSASCNRGLAAAQTPYAVLLNDDTRVTPGWLTPLRDQAEADRQIAVCQPKLLSADRPDFFDYSGGAGGYIDTLGYTFCRGRLVDHTEQDQGQYDRAVPLFWACGSAMFLRLDAVRQVGLLDLDYFMHQEEIDLCWRLGLAGYRIAAVPSSVVYHRAGFSLAPNSYRKLYLNHRNQVVLLFKNTPFKRLLWLLPLRLVLEGATALAYLFKFGPHRALAPLAGLLWCLAHPLNLWRRRRHSQALGRRTLAAGVYSGSILYQYFLRGERRTSRLVPEPPPL